MGIALRFQCASILTQQPRGRRLSISLVILAVSRSAEAKNLLGECIDVSYNVL